MKCFKTNIITLFTYLIICVCFFGCSKSDKTSKDYYENIKTKNANIILINDIALDIIELNFEVNYTKGFIRIYNDLLYYVDQTTSKVYILSPTGDITSSKLGKGSSPYEIDASYIVDYTQTDDGNHFIMGYNYNIYLYDENWKIIYKSYLNWNESNSKEELMHEYDASMHGLYALHFENLRGVSKNDYVYYEIYAEHPTFNPIISDYYYTHGRTIAKVNYMDGSVKEILGRKSGFYNNYKFLGHLSYLHFDEANNNEFYISFEADSLIYLCNNKFEPKIAFGYSGIDMNIKYTELNSFEEAYDVYYKDRQACGYYTGLKYIKDRDLLFRSYTKGKHSEFDGLQIYKDRMLIADVDVPKGFKVEGYIAPYFYSAAFSEEKENNNTYIYRFKLNI
jgi:hypothetical protein